ncbi:meiotic recombination, partial [Ascosphaera atra]
TAKFNELVADPNEESISHLTALDTVKVEKLVREFLQAQSLTILPENSFGDAVSQFVDKDDKHAMEIFLNESLDAQNKHLLQLDQRGNIDAETSDVEERLEFSEDEAHLDGSARMSKIEAELARHRAQLEEQFARGIRRRTHTAAGRRRFKPRPENWDSDLDGAWEDQPGALIVSAGESDDGMMDVDEETPAPPTTTGRGRGRGRGRGTRATPSGRGRGKTAASATVRTSRRQAVVDDEAEEASETPAPVRTTRGRGAQAAPTTLLSDDDDDNDDDDGLFVPEQPRAPPKRTLPSSATTSSRTSRNTATNARQSKTPARPAPSTTSTRTRAPAARASQQQSTLNFTRASQSQAQTPAPAQPQRRRGPFIEEDDIEEEDEDDAFDAAPLASLRSRR